ncbi:O-antigen ligase family protein [Rhizobium leguminosarum]|uniref:O-antigen ligase family protein n=1 Tax=Rhizobium leguminosarum TaxID=384 RepID=UPI001C96BAE4|nr:O-antigen ligase family protein [Rhizobium leguminosarum]MBY5569161.1 O-antigen ligase family protein [Rhizobium leguminosarum]MBY5576309.1 O-antigen ligase family protein [Rhizobium leguminosarum]
MSTSFDSYQPIGLQRHRRRARAQYRIRRETLVRIVLSAIFYISLWRATGMWYGLPADFQEGVGKDPMPMRLLLMSLVPLIGLYCLLEPRRIVELLRSASPLVGIVCLCVFLSIAFSVSVTASLRALVAVALLTAGPLLYRARYGAVDTFESLAKFAIATAFINILYTAAFPRFAVMRGSYAGMVKGAFYHKNMLGQFSAINFILLLPALPMWRLRYYDLLRWAAMLLYLVLIVLAKSSTAIILLSIGIAVYYGMSWIQRFPGRIFRSFVVLLAFALLGFVVSVALMGVAQAIAESFGKDLTLSGRTNVWEQLLPLIYERPLTGWGFALFRQPEIMEQYVRLTWDAQSTHNTYIELALNIGIPATIIWTSFVVVRLVAKMTSSPLNQALAITKRKEVVIILLILIGAFTEAGMMLAPFILWPHTVIALTSLGPEFLSRFRKPTQAGAQHASG